MHQLWWIRKPNWWVWRSPYKKWRELVPSSLIRSGSYNEFVYGYGGANRTELREAIRSIVPVLVDEQN